MGAAVAAHLKGLGHDVVGYDRVDGDDLAEAAGAGRVVYFSSAQVFGLAEGERLPDYFPVDDAHPRRAMRPYGLSKCLAEDLCAGFTARTGTPTVSLRPAATEASLVMAGRFAPSVPVRDTARFEQEPRRSLFDWSAAARVLGWEPRYTWSLALGHTEPE